MLSGISGFLTVLGITVFLPFAFPYYKASAVTAADHDSFRAAVLLSFILRRSVFGQHPCKRVLCDIEYRLYIRRKLRSVCASVYLHPHLKVRHLKVRNQLYQVIAQFRVIIIRSSSKLSLRRILCGMRLKVFSFGLHFENEKYAFRCFLLRLGFIGDEYKADRKILLSRLGRNSAWKGGKPK